MKHFLVVLAIVSSLSALFVFGLLRDPTRRDDIPSVLLDKPVPDLTLPLFDRYRADYGPQLSSEKMRGTPMVVNFWAWWCVPCRDEIPILETSWRTHQDDLLFVGIHTQPRGNLQAAKDLLREFNVTFPNGMDEDNRLNIDYGLFGIPETFFVRADGTLSYRHSGPLTQDILDQQVGALLASDVRVRAETQVQRE